MENLYEKDEKSKVRLGWAFLESNITKDWLFHPKHIYVNPYASAFLDEEDLWDAFCRHHRGDWGDVCKARQEENAKCLENGGQLLSFYRSKAGDTIVVVTVEDHEETLIGVNNDAVDPMETIPVIG